MNTLGERIRKLLMEMGISQAELARRTGMKQQTISYICDPTHPATASRYTTRIAEALGVNPVWLSTGEGNPHDTTVPIKVNGIEVKNTQVLLVNEDDLTMLINNEPYQPRGTLLSDRLQNNNGFALVILGHSMSPRFRSSDVVLIDRQLTPRPGDFVVAMLTNGTAVFRRYRARSVGFELVAENPDWSITPSEEVASVIGVMVEHRTYRDRA